jgi:hypothetical protein
MRTTPEADPSTALEFLTRGYGDVDGWLNLYASAPCTHDVIWSFPTDDLSDVTTFVRDLGDTMNIYFGVATRNRQLLTLRGGKDDCLRLPFLFADLDIADEDRHQSAKRYPASRQDALALVEQFPLAPTVIVWTGGGVHVYWALRPPLSAAGPLLGRLKATAFRLAAEFGVEVDNVFEVARMMRLPGSLNVKATPVLVKIISADWSRIYTARDWGIVLDELPPPPPARRSLLQPALRLRGSQGSDWPECDEFNASHSVHDVLFDAGWSVHRETTDRTEYVRPDKTTMGVSATVYANEPERVVVWTDAAGVPSMRGYDAWGLHVFLNHGGDFAAATKDTRLQRFGRWRQRATSQRGGLRLRSGL